MSRMAWLCRSVLVLMTILAGAARAAAQDTGDPARESLSPQELAEIQSSCVAKATGEQISAAGFDASAWHQSDLPATVVGALVTD